MIGWSIKAAQKSGVFADIVVSTDDDEIAEVAKGLGASVPFMRPLELADDFTGTVPVIADAVERLSLADDVPVCCLYATAPFVTADNLIAGYNAVGQAGDGFAFTVTGFDFPIQRALRLVDGKLVPREPDSMPMRSQDLEEMLHDAGQFYWGKAGSWCRDEAALWDDAIPIMLHPSQVQDIDTPEDWERAELMMHALRSGNDD